MELDVQRARTFVKEWSSGASGDTARPVVLMLHGNPDTHAIWEKLATRLSGRFRCLAPDLPGMGKSSAPDGWDASLASQSAWVNALCDALSLREPFHLCVHDIGGPFGLSFTCDHPERVRSLAIGNTLFQTSYRWHPWARVWRTRVLGELSMALMNRSLFIREVSLGARKMSRAEMSRAYDQITPRGKKAVLTWYRAMTPARFARWEDKLCALTKERIPTTVVWGDNDPYIPNAFATRFGTDNVRRFPDAGHWVIAEEADAIGDHLASFFSSSSKA
jgi:pimeloyl-ACP methyl ester carboxylesterase